MQATYKNDNKNLKIRKAIGREHLYANRVEDALAVFAGILRDHPEDVESLVILGDLYLASGDSSTAVQLYSRAIQQKKEDIQIEQRLQLAQFEKIANQDSPESIPAHPEAVARLLKRLTGRTNPITEAEIHQAGDLLGSILKSQNPSDKVAERLEDIDNLLPALIELNIRQARADGRYDLAEALQKLQINIGNDLDTQKPITLIPSRSNGRNPGEKIQPTFTGRALVLANKPNQPSIRVAHLAEGLGHPGSNVDIKNEFSETQEDLPQIIIASNPHPYPEIMSALAACTAARLPIIVDIDTDFEQMPLDHPDYGSLGLGTQANTRAYMSALLLADLVTVPSHAMAASLKNGNYPVMVIPDGWSNKYPQWDKHPDRGDKLHLGWIGQPGQFEDVAQIRRVIVRILREFPETQLVIVGDQHVYHLFESIPGNRRRYLPLPPNEEFPKLLDQIDILLVPFRNNNFNRSQSDKLIVQANIKSIPWIASPIPSFIEWQAGGLIANTNEEWHIYLRQLIMDADTRQSLQIAGKQRAQTRELNHLKHAWFEAIKYAQNSASLVSLR